MRRRSGNQLVFDLARSGPHLPLAGALPGAAPGVGRPASEALAAEQCDIRRKGGM